MLFGVPSLDTSLLTFIAPVMWCWMFLPLLHLRTPPVEQPARLRASWVCVSVCRCCSAGRQDVRSIHAGEVNPVTLTCCGFEAPTSSAPFSAILPPLLRLLLLLLLSQCLCFLFFVLKDPQSHIFLHITHFLAKTLHF